MSAITALMGPDRRRRTCCSNFQPPLFSSQLVSPFVVPETGDGEIRVAVAIEITGLHVGDPGDAVGDHMIDELFPTGIFENEDRPDAIVAWREHAKPGHDQIEVAIAVEVRRFDVRGRRDWAADGLSV